MKTIRFDHYGKPADILETIDAQMPEPEPGEARVKVIASPINPSDIMFVQNLYGIRPQLPSAAGFEGVGVVDAVGEGVQILPGTRVSFTGLGAWGEYAIVHHKSMIPVPESMTDDIAAQLFVNPFTAYAMVKNSGVKAGEWLMLTAAASAFGKLVIQFCQREGIKTIGTVRRDDLNDELRALGLTEIINTETEDMSKRVREITDKQGVSAILDAVGGNTTSKTLKCLGQGGTLYVYGLLSLQEPTIDIGLMIFKELTIKGFWLTSWMKTVDAQTRMEVAQNVITMLASGQIQLPVEATYNLDQIAQAVEHVDKPGRWGKILVKP
jgi:NADPH:quinone reductase-like Zn-dependent oxidoreductase